MVTIILPISRQDYLSRVITSLELLSCVPEETNILAIVDGDTALYVRARNLVNGMKFNQRLVVKAKLLDKPPRFDVPERRKRIAAIHNQAKEYIGHSGGYVLLVEDDTTFGHLALVRLLDVARRNRAFGMAMGVELARWGVPYVGAWKADDIYEPKVFTSVANLNPVPQDEPEMRIDAGGMYCALVKDDLYKQHTFHCENGLGPDVNLGIELRQLGYENFLVWQIQCTHYNNKVGKEEIITPQGNSKQLILSHVTGNKWRTTY